MEWAIVEVMGHSAYAGEVSETTRAGVSMLVVRVPDTTQVRTVSDYEYVLGVPTEFRTEVRTFRPGYSVELAGPSLFRVRSCTEEQALRFATRAPYLGEDEVEETSSPRVRVEAPPRLLTERTSADDDDMPF